MDNFFEIARNKMVDEQLIPRGISSLRVLDTMRNVPRHLFVPENLRHRAYDDSPLPICMGQTISQPYIVAFMSEQIDSIPGKKVLEIGTGSGYQTAVLAYLGYEVYSIEYHEELAVSARRIFNDLNINNIKVRHGNGYLGWSEEAPFDAIIVTAAPEEIPEILIEQLAESGQMIVPVGAINTVQDLKSITKHKGTFTTNDLFQVRFVPMVK
jgi:protein-L-isoaspartate(D-aspartate) O-methyltransferase